MTKNNKKQFGVWMDTRQATIVGKADPEAADFVVLGHVKNEGPDKNSNENAANHQESALTHKYFKEIAALMPNVNEVYVTGTGQVQEEFIHFLGRTPQFKHAVCSESTSNKMGEELLVSLVSKHFKR